MTERHLLIRADASRIIGLGHIMRSMAIAQAWQDLDGDVTFASVDLPDALQSRICKEGFRIRMIAARAGSPADASELLCISEQLNCRAIVLDGYTFGVDYHAAIAQAPPLSVAIDDNAHLKKYQTDFVLNQNAGATEALYPSCSSQTQLLLGTSYALLRREFLVNATAVKFASRIGPNRILVTLGGSDPNNITETVVEGLSRFPSDALQVRIVVGPLAYPIRGNTKQSATADFSVLQNVTDMSEQYLWADVVISAGGSSNWEMCYYGLPRIILVTANNQREIARELERIGVAINLGDAATVTPDAIHDAVDSLISNVERMGNARREALAMVDGKGAARCVRRLTGETENLSNEVTRVTDSGIEHMTLRVATMDDWRLLLEWRNSTETRLASRDPSKIDEESHREWLRCCLENNNQKLMIAEFDSAPVGTVRLDLDDVCEVSWTVAPEARGKGMGRVMVSQAVQSVRLHMKAVTGVNNIASRKIAEAAGFKVVANDGKWVTYHREPERSRNTNE